MGVIVVGVDGSEAALDALDWAIAESRLRAARLVVAYAFYSPDQHGPWPLVAPDDEDQAPVHHRAQLARRAIGELLDARGTSDLEIEVHVVESGHPARMLVDLSTDADLLVVGRQGHGGFTDRLVGSVSQRCLAHARCPVVVVRPPDDGDVATPARP